MLNTCVRCTTSQVTFAGGHLMFDDIRALEVMVCPGVAEGLGGRAVVSFRLETGTAAA